ncbi:capsid assembly scaffolding protein Gp46 family protein [Meiothermus granaticius]|uniref:Phage minor structural protein GP20 n=1 Tax=Meiothermus granaticius NBRC 107808 TaxID=1227551 RepID=A0A399FDU0_9DEIN|nr:DUF4355 domain-containing protein [Meiothermus granaticius]RIH93996.1 hypothetical protein Mgrana_00082 [Meiothermus granaticius NBRC 107808]GEM88175.1 hypothetical protein MGR01S_28000 [Meiothermus granaticius NBRC 107808]
MSLFGDYKQALEPLMAENDGANSGGSQGGGNAGDSGNNAQEGGDEGDEPKLTLTQAELDKLIAKRLERDRKAREAEQRKEQTKAQLSEEQRKIAEAAEKEARAAEREKAAAQRELKAEARAQALELGIRRDRLDAALRLADLDDALEDGTVNEKAVRKALEKVLKDYPEWSDGGAEAQARNIGGGSNPGGSSAKSTLDMNAAIRRKAGRF